MGDKVQRSVDVQIALLEAQLGIIPSIQWCAGAAKNPKFKGGLDAASNALEKQQELAALRILKTKQRLFWVKNEIGRALKKAKAFCIRKLIRKIKSADSGVQAQLEQKLRDAKAIKHLQEADHFFERFIHFNESDYLRDKLGQLGLRDSTPPSTAPNPILTSQKSIKGTLSILEADLVQFLKKLYHEQVTGGSPNAEACEAQTESIESCPEESYFVDSLNPVSNRSRRRIWEEDQTQDGRRRKNRMGQQARRALAESKYGQGAKHLKLPTDKQRHLPRSTTPQEAKKDVLHPSWHAKQQAKEREKLARFQGTKKTFASSSSDNDE